jgi:hypothetical protein
LTTGRKCAALSSIGFDDQRALVRHPLDEFTLYQAQAEEVDELQARIRGLTSIVKAVAIVDPYFSD